MRNCQTVFQVTAPFYNPTNNGWKFRFLHILTILIRLSVFISLVVVNVKWYILVIFICFFSNYVEHLFMCLLAGFVSTWKNVYSPPWPFFKLDCLSFYCWVLIILSMFWLQVPYQIFANTLSHFMVCLFPFLMISFAAQKVFNLMKSSYLFSSLVLIGKFCTIFNGIIILGWVNICPWIFYDFFPSKHSQLNSVHSILFCQAFYQCLSGTQVSRCF